MDERDAHYYSRRRPKSRKKTTVVFFFMTLFILIFFLLFFYNHIISQRSTTVVKASENIVKEVFSPSTPTPAGVSLEQVVQNELIGTSGSYAVVIQNLGTDEKYFFNQHKQYASASLYKLWIMGTAYEQIKNGVLDENEILSEDVQVLNTEFNIATESAEKKDGKITLSVNDALFKMITISDNYAALLLTEKVKLLNVNNFLKDNGFLESSVGITGGVPTTSASDIAYFFERLYKGQLIDKLHSDKMLSLLKAQRLNGKIPRNLPEDIVVAHKTGELDTFTHDAGIVYVPMGDYIIVVLSQSYEPDLAVNRIVNISEAVYKYFIRE